MKKLFIVLLCVTLATCGFVSCTSNQDLTDAANEPTQEESKTEDPETEPVNTDPIKIGSISGILGTMDVMVCCKAVQLYLNEINAVGGINGRPVELTFYDDGLVDPANTLLYSEKLVENDEVVAVVGPFFVLTWQGIEDYYLNKGIPIIGADGVHSAEYESPISFPINQAPVDWGTTDAKYAKDELGAKTVAIVYTEGVGYAEEWARGVREFVATTTGVELARECAVPNGEVNYTPTILQLKEAEADVVLILVGEVVYPGFYQELQRQDYNPAIVASSACMSTAVSDAVTENLIGTIASSAFDVSEDNEMFATYKASLEETYPGTVDNPYGFASYLSAKLFVDTVMKLDPNNITSAAIIDELNKTTGWESGATSPLTFTADDHSANNARVYYQYEGNGVWTKVSDWIAIND